MYQIRFSSDRETFQLDGAENSAHLYFPIAGEKGLKGSLTPNLSGDAMLDQETFVLEPVTVEGLHNNKSSRNFWLNIHDRGIWSVTHISPMFASSARRTNASKRSVLPSMTGWM